MGEIVVWQENWQNIGIIKFNNIKNCMAKTCAGFSAEVGYRQSTAVYCAKIYYQSLPIIVCSS